MSNLQEIARNSDWFIALFALVVIGRLVLRQPLENRSSSAVFFVCLFICSRPTVVAKSSHLSHWDA